MTTLIFDNLKIEKSSNESYYITIDNWTIYLDHGIYGEKILSHWLNDKPETSKYIKNSVITY